MRKGIIIVLAFIMSYSSIAGNNPQDSEYNSEMRSDISQDVTDSQKRFRFIYLAPDKEMNRDNLINRLKDYANHINAEGSPALFYLPDNKTPIVVTLNLKNGNNDDLNDELISNLKKTMSWKVTSDFDCEYILSLLSKYDFINTSGEIKYKQVDFDFQVGSDFWKSGNNEKVIGTLFFELNIAKYLGERMQFNVYYRGPEYMYNECVDKEKPFGSINYDNINSLIKPRREED